MKAILNTSVLVRFLRVCLLLAMVLTPSQPAFCEELKAEQIIERCKSKLDTEEAVLLNLYSDNQFIVISARNHKLDGEVVKLEHIIGTSGADQHYLYYKTGNTAPVLKLSYSLDTLSQEEAMTLKRYYAEEGKITITLSSNRSQKIFHPKTSRKAHHR